MHHFGNAHPNHALAALLRSGSDYLAARANMIERAAGDRYPELRFECDRLLREIARRADSMWHAGESWGAPVDTATRIASGPRTLQGTGCARADDIPQRTTSSLTIRMCDEHVARLEALAERRGMDIDTLIEQMATVMFAHFDSETRLRASSRAAREVGPAGPGAGQGRAIGESGASRMAVGGNR